MKTKRFTNLIKFAVVFGNVFFIYAILYERLTEMFASSLMQLFGYGMLVGLLAINTFLVMKGNKRLTQ